MSKKNGVELAEPPVMVSASGNIAQADNSIEGRHKRLEARIKEFVQLGEEAGEQARVEFGFYLMCLFEDPDRSNPFECWEGNFNCFEYRADDIRDVLVSQKQALTTLHGAYRTDEMIRFMENIRSFGKNLKESPVFKAILMLTALDYKLKEYSEELLTEKEAQYNALITYMKAIARLKKKHPELSQDRLAY